MFNIGAAFIKAIVGGIYRTVARAYKVMYDFVEEGNFSLGSELLADKIDSMTDSIYTLIAVFMLFRITVTMIEYLIDPDKLTDKNSGTGKLITRIIISLLLVISFNDIIMPKVVELQTALLSKDSILFKFFEVGEVEAVATPSSECINRINSATETGSASSSGMSGLVETVSNCEISQSLINAVKSKLQEKTTGISINIQCKKDGDKSSSSCDNFMNNNYFIKNGEWNYKSGSSGTYTFILTEDEKEAERFESGYKEGYTTGQITSGAYETLDSLSESPGGKFALDVAASFSTEPEKVKETNFLGSPSELNEFATLVEEEVIDYDTFLSIICGIIIIIFLLILCIEVVIRNLKLILLQLLAPIAFISYINPNDKVLGNWFKKFIGCYLDLFIKLFAIQIAMYLINLISDGLGGGLQKILVYLAIFIFAKTIPNLISDIFGIKDMGGTFKESMGALKNAALYGTSMAGGAIGGVAALAGGATLGQAGKVFTSGFSGKPGNVNKAYGTARGAAQKRKASGASWSDAQKAEFPWNKGTEQIEEGRKNAGANYKGLDGALEGTVFSQNKALGQLDNLFKEGTIDDKVNHARDFGVDVDHGVFEHKDSNGNISRTSFSNLSTEEKLNAIDSSWGDRLNSEKAKALISATQAVSAGTANDFQQNIFTLAQKLDSSEKYIGIDASGVSSGFVLSETEKQGRTEEQQMDLRIEKAQSSLKKAKEHNKSGYQINNN